MGFLSASKETKYGPKLDIWSVGCILAEPGASSCRGKGRHWPAILPLSRIGGGRWAIETELKTAHVFFLDGF